MRLNVILIDRTPWNSSYHWEFRLTPSVGVYVVNTSTRIRSFYLKWLFWDFQIRYINSKNHGQAFISSSKTKR